MALVVACSNDMTKDWLLTAVMNLELDRIEKLWTDDRAVVLWIKNVIFRQSSQLVDQTPKAIVCVLDGQNTADD